MGCLFKSNQFHNIVLSCVLIAFSVAALNPQPLFAKSNIGFNEANFGAKIQKLIDKAWKCHEKLDSQGLMNIVMEIKGEVESYTGKKINLDKEIDRIESDLKKKGGKPPKSIFKHFKKLIKNNDKKKNMNSSPMNCKLGDEQTSYCSSTHKKQNVNNQEELPLRFVLAVTLILGGAL